ncbi:hypothetical protein Tco_0807208 [Tanacetum coccineum]
MVAGGCGGDFTDLNKACPKTVLYIPVIDWKSRVLLRIPFTCFLGTHTRGFDQIKWPWMRGKKPFTKTRCYCYTKMPLLKNAGALSSDWHTKINMKLNHNKKHFLGLQRAGSRIWIECLRHQAVSKKKKKLSIQLPSPRNGVKKYKSLNGSSGLKQVPIQVSKQVLPLFNTSKSVEEGRLPLDTEAEEAFTQLSSILAAFPASRPTGEELIMYLSRRIGGTCAMY